MEAAMSDDIKLLFGLDDSVFSKDALVAVGNMLKGNSRTRLTLYHGCTLQTSLLTRLPLSQDRLNAYREAWREETDKFMQQARSAVRDTGFADAGISMEVDENCKDAAEGMVVLAESEGFTAVGVGRWGTATVGRQVIGCAAYRLACMADLLPVWIVNPRMTSRHVLLCVVGASASYRVVDHVAECFSHLKDSTFTLFHIIPPLPVQDNQLVQVLEKHPFEEQSSFFNQTMKEYSDKVRTIMDYGTEKLLAAGVPESNIRQKIQYLKEGIARDIITEVEEGDHGILVIGRKGSKAIDLFGLGSKAYKLVCTAPTFITCLVD
jgi:hypothetical protein